MAGQQKQCQIMTLRYLPRVLGIALALLFVGMLKHGWQWWQASQKQAMVTTQNLPEAIAESDHLMALHQALLPQL